MAFLNFYSTAAECGIGTDSTLAGSFDSTYCSGSVQVLNNRAGPFMNPGPGTHADLWFHCEIYGDNTLMNSGTADGQYFVITTNTAHSFILDIDNGNIRLFGTPNSGITTVGLSTTLSCPWRLARVALDVNVKAVPGGPHTCEVYINGVLSLSSSIPNATAAITTFTGLSWITDDIDGNIYLSQMIVANEDTRGLKLSAMKPNAAGDTSAWVGDFNQVIESDGTFLASNTADQREDWNLEAYLGPASPTGIQLFQKTIAVAGQTGPQGIAPYLRIGGTNYDGATVTDPIINTPVITSWATNPATGLPWATADLGSLIAGVRSVT